MYMNAMPYIKTLIIILIVSAFVLFGVYNTQNFVLSFLSYRLIWPLPLWLIIMLCFFVGIIPIFIIGMPEKLNHFITIRKIKSRQSKIEKAIKS